MAFGDVFLTVLLLVMGLSLIVLGLFAAYFGTKRVRSYGAVLAVVGVIVWLLTYLSKGALQVSFTQVIYTGVLYILSAIVGMIVALLVFIAVLLKT